MAKKYNIGKKSDMRRLQRDLEKSILSMAEQSIKTSKFEINCPHCNSLIMVSAGKQICPKCSNEIDVTLNLEGF